VNCYNSHIAQSRESGQNAENEFTLKLKSESNVSPGFSTKEAKPEFPIFLFSKKKKLTL